MFARFSGPSPPSSGDKPAAKRRARPPHQRLTIRVEADGLLLSPLAHAAGPSARVHRDGRIESVKDADAGEDAVSCIAYGVIGRLDLFAERYVLCVGASEVVASLPGSGSDSHPVRRVTGVFAIPLGDHERAMAAVAEQARKRAGDADASETDLTDIEAEPDDDPIEPPVSLVADSAPTPSKRHAGLLGLGAMLWRPAARPAKASTAEPEHAPPEPRQTSVADAAAAAVPANLDDAASRARLDAKILRAVLRELRGGSMYYSADADLTRNAQAKVVKSADPKHLLAEPAADVPLFQRADRRFVFNDHLAQPFARAGLPEYAMPILQGASGRLRPC